MWQAFKRIKLDSFGTPALYKEIGEGCGLEMLDYTDRTGNLVTHYKLVRREQIRLVGKRSGGRRRKHSPRFVLC